MKDFVELKSAHDCGASVVYSTLYDAMFCPRCAAWTERRCSDPDCSFCATRPEVPPTLILKASE